MDFRRQPFPDGVCEWRSGKNHPGFRKKYLCSKLLDFCGPMKNAGAMLQYALCEENDEIIGVLLSRKTNFETIDALSTIDPPDRIEWISGKGKGKKKYPVVNFDLPEGEWTLSILTVSYKGGEKRTEGYLNPVDPEKRFGINKRRI